MRLRETKAYRELVGLAVNEAQRFLLEQWFRDFVLEFGQAHAITTQKLSMSRASLEELVAVNNGKSAELLGVYYVPEKVEV